MKQEFIQFAPLVAGLAEDERVALDENFAQNQLTASATMFSAGSAADALYLVGQGFVRLMTASGINLATLGPGSVLGEDSFFRSLPYDVSAVAVSDLEFWKLLSDGAGSPTTAAVCAGAAVCTTGAGTGCAHTIGTPGRAQGPGLADGRRVCGAEGEVAGNLTSTTQNLPPLDLL